MSLLKVFLSLMVEMFPNMIDPIAKVLDRMQVKGHFSEESKKRLIREIKPSRHKDIDAAIDAEVAKRFPSDEETPDADSGKEPTE